MEQNGMTDNQFKTFLQLIIQIIEMSKTKEEALEKINDLYSIK